MEPTIKNSLSASDMQSKRKYSKDNLGYQKVDQEIEKIEKKLGINIYTDIEIQNGCLISVLKYYKK